MLFHSFEFAIFLPIVLILYVFLPHIWQNRMLLLASYIFYGAWDWRYVSLLLISTVVDFFCARGIEATEKASVKKAYVTLSICANLAMLCTFKYYDFFAHNFQNLMGGFGIGVNPFFLNVALPIGISFFTFQTMSYTIDVYRGKVPAARNILDFSLYVSFFPQLIAGPIERGTRLLPQILAPRELSLERVYRGAYLLLWGLFLKSFIADNIAELVDPVYAPGIVPDGASVIISTYAFAIQIYCDFAGYSFMAIGMACIMGFDLMENFRRPYFSKNISEFWRRWHISLSTWFRDYVFSPYYIHVQNWRIFRKMPIKLRHAFSFAVALFITEFMLGLWHGAGWNFAFFGVYHAVVVWAYYYTSKYWNKMPTLLQIFLTFQIACIGWLVFRAETFGQAVDMFMSIFLNFSPAKTVLDLGPSLLILLGCSSILLIIQFFQHKYDDTYVVLKAPYLIRVFFLATLVTLIMLFGKFGDRPFIYFQF